MKKQEVRNRFYNTCKALFVAAAICICFLLVPQNQAKAASGWMNELKPYQYTNVTEYLPSGEETFTIGGESHNEGYVFYLWNAAGTSQVLYNLKGEYQTFSFFVGHIDGEKMYTAKLKVYLDGELSRTIDLDSSDIAKTVSLDLNGAKQLKIVMESDEALNHYNIYYGIYDGVFTKNGVTAEAVLPSNMIGNCEPYDKTNVDIVRASENESYCMAGDELTDGLRFYLWNPARISKVYFNFGGNYEEMSFLFGHIDGTTRAGATLTVEADGEIVDTITNKADDLPKKVTVSLKNVHQVILSLSSDEALNVYDIYYGVASIQLKSNGKVRSVKLNTEVLNLTEANSTAVLRASIVPVDASNCNVSWKSSDESVASVDDTGVVTALTTGTAVITATTEDGGYTASCVVTSTMPDAEDPDTTDPAAPDPDVTDSDLTNPGIDISAAIVTYDKIVVHDGMEQEPNIVITIEGKELVENIDYTLSYANNTSVGTAYIFINGIGKYTGVLEKRFRIIPEGTLLGKVTAKSKGFLVKWAVQPQATIGYQIQYSTNKDFTGKTTVTKSISTNTTMKLTVKKLKAKKTYYVRIRTYQKVGNRVFHSEWSKSKKVVTKK